MTISAPPTDAVPTRRARTTREAFAIFRTHLCPVLLMGLTAAVVAARLLVADWAWSQLLIAAAVVAAQPFVEWTTHVFVLHARPLTVRGREVDLYAARKHRRHHADPRNLEILAMPVGGLVVLSLLVALVSLLLDGAAARLTLAATAAVLALGYEWLHFLIHTDVPPRSRAYKRLHRHHRLHHFRNENYWFGVTNPLGDVVLRTNPAKDDVPLSPTVKAILG